MIKMLSTSIMVLLVIGTLLHVAAEDNTIIVPDDYGTIQAAVNAAGEGDLIVVRDGVYVENVLIKKSVKIRSENGPERCIIESFSHGLFATVINISSKNVEVNGFTISGYNTGLSLVNVEGCKIVNNIFRGCYIGILLSRSSSNIMMNNTFLTKTGIDLEFSRRNKILHNNFTGSGLYVLDSWENDVRENLANGKTLVYLENVGNRVVEEAGQVIAIGCSRITVRGLNITNVTIGVDFYETRDSVIENNVISNGVFGISLMNSHNNRVVNNTLLNNTYGILLTDTRNVMVVNNTVRENLFGIGIGGLLESSSNEIVGNAIEDNDLGVGLTYSLNCKITKNVIRRNREGIGLLYPQENNAIYFNTIEDNDRNVTPEGKLQWSFEKKVCYMYDGQMFFNYLGNYWSDYNGSDVNSDGIGDTPYKVGQVIDEYPLMKPHEQYEVFYNKYLVDVSTDVGESTGGGWYEAGTMAMVNVTSTRIIENPFIIRVFKGWVDENGTLVSSSPSYSFNVTRPINLKASWETELNPFGLGLIVLITMIVVMLASALWMRRKEQ